MYVIQVDDSCPIRPDSLIHPFTHKQSDAECRVSCAVHTMYMYIYENGVNEFRKIISNKMNY